MKLVLRIAEGTDYLVVSEFTDGRVLVCTDPSGQWFLAVCVGLVCWVLGFYLVLTAMIILAISMDVSEQRKTWKGTCLKEIQNDHTIKKLGKS